VTYLFDNNFSPNLARMLALAGVDAVALRDKFDEDIKDVEFLPLLKGSGMVLITSDKHMKTREAEALALHEAGITALFFRPFFIQMDLLSQAAWLTKNWRRIEEFVANSRAGTVGEVHVRGQIRRISLRR
jgi:hypothetical protein